MVLCVAPRTHFCETYSVSDGGVTLRRFVSHQSHSVGLWPKYFPEIMISFLIMTSLGGLDCLSGTLGGDSGPPELSVSMDGWLASSNTHTPWVP